MEQQLIQENNKSTEASSNVVLAPGKMRVIKRNGKVVSFEEEKIKVAIMKAFLAVEGGSAAGSSRIHENVDVLTKAVVEVFERRMPSGGTLHIEEIQDQVRASQIAYEGVAAEYERGSRNTLDVIQSNALLLSAQISLANSEKKYLMAQYNLLKAIGLLNSQYLNLK